jgi:23S rRNA (adenine1618-N6)-methyltransferase
MPSSAAPTPPDGLHPRNPHRARYDFPRLVTALPALAAHVRPHPVAGDTIDFADPAAVLALNRALLLAHHGLARWDLPPGALCPPVPGRADYLCHVADLLPPVASAADIAVLEIGTGAGCIYPLLGARMLGWRFIATDIAPDSLRWAADLLAANALADRIELRLQPDAAAVFENVIRSGERFALSICNPPFHASAVEAEAGTRRKLRNLGAVAGRRDAHGRPVLNFGGRAHELWCPGGELGFVGRMIAESARRPGLCGWFTCLVAKSAHLPLLQDALGRVSAAEVRVLPMRHGEKFSRILAWRFAR